MERKIGLSAHNSSWVSFRRPLKVSSWDKFKNNSNTSYYGDMEFDQKPKTATPSNPSDKSVLLPHLRHYRAVFSEP